MVGNPVGGAMDNDRIDITPHWIAAAESKLCRVKISLQQPFCAVPCNIGGLGISAGDCEQTGGWNFAAANRIAILAQPVAVTFPLLADLHMCSMRADED